MFLRQIEYLQAVIENGNFYQAAEQCHVSQSAISQQIKKLEEELDVKLLERHNRTFSLTPAGVYFYQKSVVILSDCKQMIRDTKRIANKNHKELRIGYYKGYSGNELSDAIASFSENHPTIDIQIMVGSHEEIYHAMENDTIDLGINDQRRAFSDAYQNILLTESTLAIEISQKNPLSKLNQIEINDLKNTPCILVINDRAQKEEQNYYQEIIGIKSPFLFASSIQEARLKYLTGQGYMPIDVLASNSQSTYIPLVRNKEKIKKNYCVFYRKDHTSKEIEEFTSLLKAKFIKKL